MIRVLVSGGAGQVGRELARQPWPDRFAVHVPDEADFDITDDGAVQEALAAARADVVVNAAAYTAVDRAEREPDAAERVNATAVARLAAACDAAGACLIHLSTDYVFDGTHDGWYDEDDEPRPESVYGRTKLAGEHAALGAECGLVLRTSWVYGALGDNFVRTVRRRARREAHLSVVGDQRGCPTAAADLAAAVRDILDQESRPRGLFHAAAPDEATWWDLAAEAIALMDPAAHAVVERITTAERPAPARRPSNSRLSSARLERAYGVRLRPWREALAEVSRELNGRENGSDG